MTRFPPPDALASTVPGWISAEKTQVSPSRRIILIIGEGVRPEPMTNAFVVMLAALALLFFLFAVAR
jgi:hypothetical protein